MLKVAIWEHTACIPNLEIFINEYNLKKETSTTIKIFDSVSDFLEKFTINKYDIIFIEFSLPHIYVLDIIRHIKNIDENIVIIIIAETFDQYSNKLFLDYNNLELLLKLISYAKIESLFDKIKSKYFLNNKNKLILKNQNGIHVVLISDIIYIETNKKSIIVHTETQQYSIYTKMYELQYKLKIYFFFRCHKSYLINIPYIEKILDNNLILKGTSNNYIPISKYKKNDLLQFLSNY